MSAIALKIWGFLKKIPWWVYVILMCVVTLGGWYIERRAHKKTKQKLAAESDRADRAEGVAAATTEARDAQTAAEEERDEKQAELDLQVEEAKKKEEAVEERIDEHAGDVDKTADAINKELGLE
jgi:flagellar biosynthesis/type III secretory pathway M-ring protein FliF/YscJ